MRRSGATLEPLTTDAVSDLNSEQSQLDRLNTELGFLHPHQDREELGKITGQKAAVRKAKKSIAQFKVRQGMPIGAMVTLRGDRMWEFLDRLMSIALPRVRDFRGVSSKGFDGRGNYTLGLKDQLLFPEIDYLKVDKTRGMNISVVTTARTDEEARRLLALVGIPFRQS